MDRRSLWKKVEVPTWTLDKVWEISAGCSGKKVLSKINSPLYKFLNKPENKEMLDKVCSHMNNIFKWTPELVQEEALKYKTRTEFGKGSPGAYKYAKRNKLLDKVYSHMNNRFKWTSKSVQEEALKYKTRYEFSRLNDSAYQYAKRNKILDKICSHMKKLGEK